MMRSVGARRGGRHTRTRDRPYHQPPLPLPLPLAIFRPDYLGGSSVPEVTVKIAMQPRASFPGLPLASLLPEQILDKLAFVGLTAA
jgi:hypothetical protein